jgi:hypothetical protein
VIVTDLRSFHRGGRGERGQEVQAAAPIGPPEKSRIPDCYSHADRTPLLLEVKPEQTVYDLNLTRKARPRR